MSEAGSDIAATIDALYQRGDFAGVVAAADAAPNAIRRSAPAMLQVGLALALTGAPLKAQATLKRASNLNPADPAIIGALARVHLLLGETAAAEALCAKLRAAAGADPGAAHYLAEVELQAGRAEDAYATMAGAVARFNHPLLDIRFAEAALRTRRVKTGVAAARRAAVRLGLIPAVVKVAGPAAMIAGDEALLSAVGAALDKMPAAHAAAVFDYWTGVLMSGDLLALARQCAERAAALAPTPDRRRLLADLHLAARDLAGAEEAARGALDLAPADGAAMTLLARCRMNAGEVGEAKDLLLRAVAADPGCAIAFDYLTQIDAALMTPAHAAALEKKFNAGAIEPQARPAALLALARRDENAGEHARAFRRILEAKAQLAASRKAGGAGYRPEDTEQRLKLVTELFAAPMERAAEAAPPRLIFIVGMPRSGTSLVEQILASHPGVFGGGERPDMVNIMNEFAAAAAGGADARRLIGDLGPAWAARYLAALPDEARLRGTATDKHPINFWSIGLVRALYPDAAIVSLRRPAVDVCLSILRLRFFGEYAFANEIGAVAHYFSAYERMMAHWRALFGDIHEVDYEALVADPERETRALLDRCRLPWSDRCLAFHETKRAVITHSAAQVREPIHDRAARRRADYGEALAPLEEALARFGVQTR